MMDNENIVIKMRVEGDYVVLSTYSRQRGHRGPFLLYLDELREWLLEDLGEWHLRDYCGDYDSSIGLEVIDGIAYAEIYWSDGGPDAPGFYQNFTIPVAPLRALLRDGTPLRHLYVSQPKSPHIAASRASETIRRVCADKLARRALSKAMRDCFSEQSGTVVLNPNGRRSFSFSASSGSPSFGYLILHETAVETPVGEKTKLAYCVHASERR